MRVLIGAIIGALVLTAAAHADRIPPCPLPSGVAVAALDQAPASLRKDLAVRIGDLVPPGEPFDSTDVVVTGKHRRLIFVWHKAQRWIIATENGGRGYNDPLVAYDVKPGGDDAIFIEKAIAFPGSVCTTAVRLLEARAP